MEIQFLLSIILSSSLLLFLLKKTITRNYSRKTDAGLPPPSPPALPLIGNLHQLGRRPHRSFQSLARKHGPIMLLQLGRVPTLVISSAEMAREVTKTHDVVFAGRPRPIAVDIFLNGHNDFAFSSYGDYWRRARKLCVIELLSQIRVQSFQPVRREETVALVEKLRLASGQAVDVSALILGVVNNIVARCVLGRRCEGRGADILLRLQREGGHDLDLSWGNIKAILVDMMIGGTDTTSTTIEWIMTQLARHPSKLQKAQEEIRRVVGQKLVIEHEDLAKMHYLKLVIKETLRPRETLDNVEVAGFGIAVRTRVLVNTWAIQRDPTVWENPDEFIPERFENSPVDWKGRDFQYIPFGAGRRGCPGLSFGTVTLEFVTANLLYWLDWELPKGLRCENLDMKEVYGLTTHKDKPLFLVPIPHSF
ncbi:unnamed protein product [Linum tenue]|uniref:Cytochrome P450 71A1 n=1 Tax=Linum tenue TaxID=586396 RepID=A0AAV0KX49_9ROSI|nr:unnamed protein product [Linum tenue]